MLNWINFIFHLRTVNFFVLLARQFQVLLLEIFYMGLNLMLGKNCQQRIPLIMFWEVG